MKHNTLILSAFTMLMILSCNENEVTKRPSGEGVFTTELEHATISGELFLPEGNGPFPVLVIVPGSGLTPKEEQAAFAPVINALGYALYVYDKRGVGGSTGTYPLETIENPVPFLEARAQDVISIVEWLPQHADIKSNEIGLFGSSQGTWVSTLVYRDIPDQLAKLIMVSGGAASTGVEHFYEELIEEQGLNILQANQQLLNYDGNVGFDPREILEEVSISTLFTFGGQDNSHPTIYDSLLVSQLEKENFEIHWYDQANHELLEMTTQDFPETLFPRLGEWLTNH